jgi:acetyl esterase/lipase
VNFMVRITGFAFGVVAFGFSVTPAKAAPGADIRIVKDIAYASAQSGDGRRLDLYLPRASEGQQIPVVIWTRGSAWLAQNGKEGAQWLADGLVPRNFAVVGVSIRSSDQAHFPAQVHDIKAAIRWLRANAKKYGFDAQHIGIVGDSSGGWTAAMAALTGDARELEGTEGVIGFSSAVEAAVAFYPPTNFLEMDSWIARPCTPDIGQAMSAGKALCHKGPQSPESRLLGCSIEQCPAQVHAADPATYVSAADPPLMILHGQSDPLVPHNQGERLYQALALACRDAEFISLPYAGHGPSADFLTKDAVRADATIRSSHSNGCVMTGPAPVIPTFDLMLKFLESHLK